MSWRRRDFIRWGAIDGARGREEYVPLYEGKMVQSYDHRAAGIVVNPANLHRPRSARAGEFGAASRCDLVAGAAVLGGQHGVEYIAKREMGAGFKDITRRPIRAP